MDGGLSQTVHLEVGMVGVECHDGEILHTLWGMDGDLSQTVHLEVGMVGVECHDGEILHSLWAMDPLVGTHQTEILIGLFVIAIDVFAV